jgi:hypothetical protein
MKSDSGHIRPDVEATILGRIEAARQTRHRSGGIVTFCLFASAGLPFFLWLAFCLLLFLFAGTSARDLVQIEIFRYLYPPIALAAGPALYILFRRLSDPVFRIGPVSAALFLPGLLAALLNISFSADEAAYLHLIRNPEAAAAGPEIVTAAREGLSRLYAQIETYFVAGPAVFAALSGIAILFGVWFGAGMRSLQWPHRRLCLATALLYSFCGLAVLVFETIQIFLLR